MNTVFSAHSLLKLGYRNISKQKVIQIIKNPDAILPSLSNRKMDYKKFGKELSTITFESLPFNIFSRRQEKVLSH